MLLLRNLGSISLIIGGILWTGKPLYDWLILEREINTGYPPSNVVDYLSFLIPLFCLVGILGMFSVYGKKIGISSAILSLSLLLISTFYVSESYFYGSSIPSGLIFLFPGLLFLMIGAFILFSQIKHHKVIPRIFLKVALTLCALTLTFCISPFFTQQLDNKTATFITTLLMVLIGLIWSIFGICLFRLQGSMVDNLTQDEELDFKLPYK